MNFADTNWLEAMFFESELREKQARRMIVDASSAGTAGRSGFRTSSIWRRAMSSAGSAANPSRKSGVNWNAG